MHRDLVSKLLMQKNINQQFPHPVELLRELASFLNGRLKRGGHSLSNTKQFCFCFCFRVSINL